MFEIRPYPDFSWSISRQRLLDDCPRAYYYRYYLGHNGWLSEASERTKLAYRLSKLANLDALLGQEMDERAREIEASVRKGEPPPSATELEERTREALRAAWLSSRDGGPAFEAKPKDHLMLTDFYLRGAPPEEADTERINEKLVVCHQNLLATPHWERLRECGREGCVPIPAFAHCYIDDIKVFGAGDLAYIHAGTLHLVDWKSGKPGADDHLQVVLAAYCLLAGDESLAKYPVQAVLEYLLAGEEELVAIPDDGGASVTETVAIGVRAMRSYLRDVKANAPSDEADFPRRESGRCPSCNFAPLCQRKV